MTNMVSDCGSLSSPPPTLVLVRRSVIGAKDAELRGVNPSDHCVLPFWEAIEGEHPTDAHLVTYAVVGATGMLLPWWCRINKAFLPIVRSDGGDVVTTFVGVDIDPADSARCWADAKQRSVFARELAEGLTRAAEDQRLPALARPTATYFTRRGARLLYVLSRFVPADLAEPHIRGLLSLIAPALPSGFVADPKCADWTRLFRLPKVLRDGLQTSEESYFDLTKNSDARMDLWAIPPSGPVRGPNGPRSVGSRKAEAFRPELPNETEIRSLLDTEWVARASQALAGVQCFGAIFEEQSLAQVGSRDDALYRAVYQSTEFLGACQRL